MNRTLLLSALVAGIALGTATGASAQSTAAGSVQRDVNQERRIENGLQDGSITTRENALLQRDEARVDRLQSRALRDGSLSPADRARLDAAQDKASRDIHAATHNGVNGNPLSASSQRAQAETQRDLDQQRRIEDGVRDGGLTHREAARLEHGQARVAAAQDRQSARIHRQRHDAQRRG